MQEPVEKSELKCWQQGKRPDYRFSLANERTFLAWIRTALALLAGAVGLEQFTAHFDSSRTSIFSHFPLPSVPVYWVAWPGIAGKKMKKRCARTAICPIQSFLLRSRYTCCLLSWYLSI
ncbi:YidH family protein [Sodalis sp. (in: enterobacteria)]|uniref:YidH family protein n=1 Tax=Sodalis sp. (in: enterobacteria) TaxID=1898979 RepID=UPI003F3E789B